MAINMCRENCNCDKPIDPRFRLKPLADSSIMREIYPSSDVLAIVGYPDLRGYIKANVNITSWLV